jgi:hypothetical protein
MTTRAHHCTVDSTIVVDELGEGFKKESSLKVYKAMAIEKPGKGARWKGQIVVKKEKKVALVGPDMLFIRFFSWTKFFEN